jgi:membrane associated rhomboid family serine protease
MNINHILLLVAVLNLTADLYNILKFRERLPNWVLPANMAGLALCGLSWLFLSDTAGFVAIGVLIVYAIAIRRATPKAHHVEYLPSPATKLLIGLNIATFMAQIARGATDDPEAFIELGAVYTPLLKEGEWWRIFTAQFLHWGVAHLAFNMMGLWLLGRTVEAMIGFWRYIGLYLTAGAGGMLIAWWASLLGSPPHATILVGASASVLGLVGAQAAISLLAFQYTGSAVAKAQLNSMTQIVFLQAVFDMMVPEVSSTAHVGGAAVGFCVTYGFVARALRKRAAAQRQQESDA